MDNKEMSRLANEYANSTQSIFQLLKEKQSLNELLDLYKAFILDIETLYDDLLENMEPEEGHIIVKLSNILEKFPCSKANP